jgi:transposase InsO family protein
MGQVLHGSAKTTHAVRTAIQRSKATIAALAATHGVNPKTVMKWRRRQSVEDLPMGPRSPHSTVLSIEEEALCVAFRKHTLLPLDDCLYALQATIPHLTRSSLHRLYQRHDISRLPDAGSEAGRRKKFKAYPIGYFHIDIAEVRTGEGKLHMFVAIDRASKFAVVELHERATQKVAKEFLERLIATVPYKIHTVLTDNGVQFTTPGAGRSAVPEIRAAIAAKVLFRAVGFELACARNDIDHRLTKPNHPWTNGQVERMNRTLKEATIRRYHYATHDELRRHLALFIDAYNFAKRLKALRGRTPFGHIVKCWTEEPNSFILDPTHLSPGLNI